MQARRKQPNQNKPTPPLEVIEPHIRRLWAARLTDKQIVAELQKEIDQRLYGIGLTTFIKIRNSLGLQRTRQQGHTAESIRPTMIELRGIYPDAGVREMISLAFHEHNGMAISRNVMQEYFRTYEPHLVRERKANRLRRRRFWAAGVNDLWAVDQHDKWLRFGLALHVGLEPFSGRILWMKIWHSNRNPQLILSYYLETVERLGFIPMITQSDPGTENFGIANAQTMLRQMQDSTLSGFVQHRWMRSKKNIVPEIAWSQLRRRFAPGFEMLLDQGVDEGWYDIHNTLQSMIFRWLFIPWLQKELDSYVFRINNTRKRHDKNKVLPHGIPELIHRCAADYGALDFKVTVSQDTIDHVRNLYINPNLPVFDLIPQPLDEFFNHCYDELGRPPVERTSIWGIYLQLLDLVQRCHGLDAALKETDMEIINSSDDIPIMQGQDLCEQPWYLGGVANGMGLQEEHLQKLDEFLNEEPNIGDDDEIDAGPSVWVDSFTSDEQDSVEEVDESL